ncbi:MAG: hypothetical protein QS721_14650 [Candidatus Endonucleobacter sp. (ex Gigantidas childressi)]|nr:hypothetical protein [Candidatus Endonucleobacter sp. (ex Gigantidas childressi)]
MKGIKSAAQVYFIAIGKVDVYYTKTPDEFVYLYGCHLWSVPFFSTYQGSAASLSEYMMLLQPGREAVSFAARGALMATVSPEYCKILKRDEIRADIAKYEASGRKPPPIAEILRG